MIHPKDLETGKHYWFVDVLHLKRVTFMYKIEHRKQYCFLVDNKKKRISEHDLYCIYEVYNDAAKRVMAILERYTREYKTAIEAGQDKQFYLDGYWFVMGY